MRATLLSILSPLVLLLSAVAVGNTAEAPICSIIAKPTSFDHQNVSLEGTVTELFEANERRARSRIRPARI
jgi:hypothetical protein